MMPTMTNARSDAPQGPTVENYDLLYEMARTQLDAQLSNVDAVDAKTGGVVGISTALVGILAAVLALKPTALQDVGNRWLAGLVVGGFLVVLACGFSLIRIPSWKVGPDLRRGQIGRFLGDPLDAKRAAARNLIAAYATNQKPYGAKICRLRVGVVALILQTILLLGLSFHASLLT
jgi:hypothetical protein